MKTVRKTLTKVKTVVENKLAVILFAVFGTSIAQAQSNMDWGGITDQAEQFNTTAVQVGKYGAGGVLALAMIWLVWTYTSDSPKKKEALISFLIALVINSVLWLVI